MSRRYRSEPIEVVVEQGVPAGFRWRGRRYAVQAVLGRWVEAVPWWPGESPGSGAGGQREVWRVEAVLRGAVLRKGSAGAGSAGAYDLSQASEGWSLERVLD